MRGVHSALAVAPTESAAVTHGKNPGPRVEHMSTRGIVANERSMLTKATTHTSRSSPRETQCALAVLVECGLGLVALGCALWTLWLILLTTHPNDTINRVMDTDSFDNGSFWLLVEPPLAIVVMGVGGFAVVLAGYVFVLLKLLFRRPHHVRARRIVPSTAPRESVEQERVVTFTARLHRSIEDIAASFARVAVANRATSFMLRLTKEDTRARQLLNVCLQTINLALQLSLLVQHLERGSPMKLIFLLASIIVCNALACVLMISLKRLQSGLLQSIVDVTFAFLIAVGFPMTVLVYCLKTFRLDRKMVAINLAVIVPGRFERLARAIAEPVSMADALNSLNSLRIQSASSFFTRVGTNISLCLQIAMLALRIRQRKRVVHTSVYPHRHPVALLFALVAVGVTVYVSKSVSSSEAACAPHPECVVHAFRWLSVRDGDDTQCPCITLIDGDMAPTTYAVWLQPQDATTKVAKLAAAGLLTTVQLTNRYLPVLPIELRQCKRMKHIQLMYTHIETLPVWFKEFTRLEFLHIEGKLDVSSLVSLPDDVFDDMSLLTFLHLGAHPNLRRLPSFAGLANLRSLTLAVLVQLRELPAFTSLTKLERLDLPTMINIRLFPDLTPVTTLKGFTLTLAKQVCCNGFLDNHCDFSRPSCGANSTWGDSPATCLPANRTDALATDATRAMFAKFPQSVCIWPASVAVKENQVPQQARIDACGGKLYRKCRFSDRGDGMCYSLRRMPIACYNDSTVVEMRKRQIAAGVGIKCDPAGEAWLGCPSSS